MPLGHVEKYLPAEEYYPEVAPVLVLQALYPADRGYAVSENALARQPDFRED